MARRMGQMRGFTLIELMIVLVILGILVAVGLPSYQNSISRSQRTEAQSSLLGFAQAMERHFNDNYTYAGAATGGGNTGTPLNTVYSAVTPREGAALYNLTIQAADVSSYTLRATPISGGAQDGDGLLQLDSLGRRGWDRDNDGTVEAGEFTWEQ